MYYVVRRSDPINMKTIASPPTFLFVVGKFIAINAFTGLSFYLSAVAVITIPKGPFLAILRRCFCLIILTQHLSDSDVSLL